MSYNKEKQSHTMDYQAARTAMINGQIRPNKVIDTGIINAFETIPREAFLPLARRGVAYQDEDIAVGYNRYIMKSSVLGQLLQAAAPSMADNALVVAGASGYCAALLSRLVHSVMLVDHTPGLMQKLPPVLTSLALDNISVDVGDPSRGLPESAPYSLILIDGGASHLPNALFEQLERGGRLLAIMRPDGLGSGVATLYQKAANNESVAHRALFDAFVPILPEFSHEEGFVF